MWLNAIWNRSVDLLGKVVVFGPGIAFPHQTLARRSFSVIKFRIEQDWVSQSAVGKRWLASFVLRPSKRPKLAFALRSRSWNSVFSFEVLISWIWVWSRQLDFSTITLGDWIRNIARSSGVARSGEGLVNVAWVVLHRNRRIGAREQRQLIPHVRFQVPFLGWESHLKSSFACAGLLCRWNDTQGCAKVKFLGCPSWGAVRTISPPPFQGWKPLRGILRGGLKGGLRRCFKGELKGKLKGRLKGGSRAGFKDGLQGELQGGA